MISPDTASLRRLDQLSAQLRATSKPSPKVVTETRRRTQSALKQAAVQTSHRQELLGQRFDDRFGSLDSRLVHLAQATEVALQDQTAQLQSLAMHSASQGMLASQVEALLDHQASQLLELMRQTQAESQASLRALSAELQSTQRRSQAARQVAAQAIHQSQALLENLQQAYPDLQDAQVIQANLEMAQHNLAQGYAEAAISAAQQANLQTQQLRVSLEQDTNERSLLQMAALEKFGEIEALLLSNRQVSAVDLEGRSLDYLLEVDFWAEGGWTRLQQALESIHEYLTQPPETLDKAHVMELLQDQLPRLEQAIPDVVAQARRTVLASQIRFNMAEAVLTALSEQGFVPEQAAYVEGDQRQAYQLALHNLEGSQLVVTLQPSAEGIQNQLDLHSQDHAKRTPHELRQRARELARSLRRYGMEVFNPAPIESGNGIPGMSTAAPAWLAQRKLQQPVNQPVNHR
jgi:hypothetical protein